MLNILVPLSGSNTFKITPENKYPKILTDIDGKLLVERAAAPFLELKRECKITVALPQPESNKYQLQNVLRLLGERVHTCTINGNTQGAVCSALLATEKLDLDSPLVVTSFEQVLNVDLNGYIDAFIDEGVDAGVLTFEAMHPKWSYVKTDENNFVTQASEKMPISNKAIAGFYYFKSGRLFIESAKAMIRKDVKVNNSFYIAPTLNEVILKEGKVKAIAIDKSCYFHVTDEHELNNYEQKMLDEGCQKKKKLLSATQDYVAAFDSKNIDNVIELFSDDSMLVDPMGEFSGKKVIYSYVKGVFDSAKDINFYAKNIYVTDELKSVIEFELLIDDAKLVGVDVLEWTPKLLIRELRAYLYETKTDG
ncbi:nuclear transport factor 2 family protein [Vibrio parahaemolyticus]|uniref:nuclear transport factor 2 family protein n=1 Tax=Vibrio parahaemolyticus TaxID=670 RepID=UPI00061AD5B3|nr:nuclear transport factor 2 family protein [Vibrio parahaemolyticus]EGQ8146788.1 hypothetical protein [Vibrio parahaemolyticus]EGQ8340459.1 hypothetical protein [Vibrio parahaemolyticus]EGQ8373139.1 hypothetical protein [Vibrio parahaemolyticus]EGQ8722967.1 hypothetical protein [Vibrio parahaemolyticus]EGQ8761419.1 hypothetical protein [Vibrio parahaemolyticus]